MGPGLAASGADRGVPLRRLPLAPGGGSRQALAAADKGPGPGAARPDPPAGVGAVRRRRAPRAPCRGSPPAAPLRRALRGQVRRARPLPCGGSAHGGFFNGSMLPAAGAAAGQAGAAARPQPQRGHQLQLQLRTLRLPQPPAALAGRNRHWARRRGLRRARRLPRFPAHGKWPCPVPVVPLLGTGVRFLCQRGAGGTGAVRRGWAGGGAAPGGERPGCFPGRASPAC